MPAPEPYRPAGGVAVVTGAASGIGAATAALLHSLGSEVALVDRDAQGLKDVAATLGDSSRVSQHVIDLAESDSAEHVRVAAIGSHGRVTLLVNNAGVALAGRFEQVSMADVDHLMAINLRATMALTSAFLTELDRGAHITNVSSLFGIIAPVGNAAYAASKFGVRGFSLALAAELRPRGIGVTAVHPGGIRTAIARNARRGHGVSDAEWEFGQAMFERFLVIEPDAAARRIVEGTIRRQSRVLIGPETYVGDAVARLAPAASTQIFESLMRLRARLG